MAHLNLERNLAHAGVRDLLMTGSPANLQIEVTAGPITSPTEDHHVPFFELAYCPNTITILNEDRSWMTQNFRLERHARSTFVGERNAMHSATDRDNSKASVKS